MPENKDFVPVPNLWNTIKIIVHFIWIYATYIDGQYLYFHKSFTSWDIHFILPHFR